MNQSRKIWLWAGTCLLGMVLVGGAVAAGNPPIDAKEFPPSFDSYNDTDVDSIIAILKNRASQAPFNLVATLIFFCAIVHTFLTGKFMAIAHKWEHDHDKMKKEGRAGKHSVSHGAELFHFLGEVEAVFVSGP